MIDKQGYAPANDVTVAFKNFYIERIQSGRIPDIDVDERIKNADNSAIHEIYTVINENPYNAINSQGYLFKETKAEGQDLSKEYFKLAPELIAELTPADINQIKNIVEKKLTLYYSKIDGAGAVDLQSLFNQVINGYLDAKRESFGGNSMANLIFHFFYFFNDGVVGIIFKDPISFIEVIQAFNYRNKNMFCKLILNSIISNMLFNC